MQQYFFHTTQKAFSLAACALLLANSFLGGVVQANVGLSGTDASKVGTEVGTTKNQPQAAPDRLQVESGNETIHELLPLPIKKSISDEQVSTGSDIDTGSNDQTGSGQQQILPEVADVPSLVLAQEELLQTQTETWAEKKITNEGTKKNLLIQEAQSSSEKVVSSACAGDEVDCPNDEPCGPNDPDPDADGICNSVDECDDQPGPATNNGCPVNSCVPYYPAYDYTNDSSFNDDDISLLQQVILDVIPGTPQGAGHCPLSRGADKICDVNNDGSVMTSDLVYLKKILLGVIDEGEVCGDGIDNNCNGDIDEGCQSHDVSCTDTLVEPESVVAGQGDFTITCQGTNATSRRVHVEGSNGVDQFLPKQISNVFTYTPAAQAGLTYTFTCEALFDICLPNAYCAVVCPSGVGTVVDQPLECPDPITQLTVSSHTPSQIVQNSSVTFSGTVDGNVSFVEVTVGSNVYTDNTIVNGVWSVDIVLPTQGNNPINITAYHANGDVDCNLIKKFVLVYKPASIIYDPRIEVNCDENPNRNNQFICGEEVTCVAHFNNTPGTVDVHSFTGASFPVEGGTVTEIVSSAGDVDCELFDPQGVPQALCEGSVSANTRATVIFKVKFDKCTCDDDNKFDLYGYMHVLTPTDPNLNNNFDNRQHALTNPNSTTCSDDICPDPITQLTITSHVTGQIVSTQQVTLTGTVAGGVGNVEVVIGNQTIPAVVQNGIRSAVVMLQIGSNQITVQAFPASSDPDCQVITQSITLQYVPGNQITSCTSTTVIPPEVVLNQGDFQVTCSGNSSTFGVVVDLPNGTTTTLVLPVNQNTIMYTPTMTGIYTFTCMAGDATVALFCPSATGLVTSPTIPTDVCVDPITSLTITSHIPNQTVYTQQVTLTGTISGGVQNIQVISTNQIVDATIQNDIWSATITLQTGANNILVKAYPSDAECDIVATGIKLYYYVPLVATSCEETYVTPAQVVLGSGVFYVSCSGANVSSYDILVTDPNGTNSLVPLPAGVTGTTITPTMTGQYRFQCIANGVAQNGQQVQVDCPAIGGVVTEPSSACIDPITNLTITNYTSGQTVGNQTITLQGQVEGGVDHIEVYVNSQIINATINGTTRSATVTLQTGSNHILVEAFPNDSDCSLETVQLVLNYTPGGGQCTAPVDFITVTTPISGTILTTETVVLSGTVGANAATVTVNGVAMSLNGNTRSGTIQVTPGTHTLSVVATSVDADCPTISTTVIVVYQTAVCTTPISLNISTPSNNTSTSASTILLQGTAVGSGVQVKVNNQLVTLYTSGVFESTIGLVRGTNTITVEAFNNDPVCTQSQTLSVSRTGGGRGGRPSSITCGNNRLDRGEQCDDNNTWNGDGCSSSCQFEDLCGNNRIEFGETCDDGNTRNGDGCNSSCKLEDIGLRKVITTRKRRPEPLTFRAPPQLPKTGAGMCYLPGSPVLVLYAPTSGDTTTESSILVQGNATGLTLSEVLVNGTTVAVTATGYFEISVGLMKGLNTISIELVDGTLECSTYETISVTRESIRGGKVSSITCGNNKLDIGEQCDDGNVRDGDGCSSSCQREPMSASAGAGSTVGTGSIATSGSTSQDGQVDDTTDMASDKRRPIPYVFGASFPAPVNISTPPMLPLAGGIFRVGPARTILQ